MRECVEPKSSFQGVVCKRSAQSLSDSLPECCGVIQQELLIRHVYFRPPVLKLLLSLSQIRVNG